MKSLFIVLYLLAIIANFGIAIIVLKKSSKKFAKLYFLLVVVLNLWLFGNILANTSSTQQIAQLGAKLSFVAGALIVPQFILFVIHFPRKIKHRINSLLSTLTYVLSLPLVALSLTNFFVKDMIIRDDKINLLITGDYHWIYSSFVSIFVCISLFIFYQKYKTQDNLSRVKLKYVLAGFVVASLNGFIFALVLQPIFKVSTSGAYGSLGTIFISLGIVYAIFRYRFLDIKIVIRKSLIQIVTFAIIFGLYAYILLFIQRSSSSTISLDNNTTLLFAVLIIAATIEPLRRLIYKWIDGLFESKERDREESLKRMQLLSASNVQFETLQKKTEGELSKVLEADSRFVLFNKELKQFDSFAMPNSLIHAIQRGQVLIKDEITYKNESGDTQLSELAAVMQKEEISVIIPVGKDADLLGMFVINDSRQKNAYTLDKIEFMKHFAGQVEFAFASSLAYKYAIERINI